MRLIIAGGRDFKPLPIHTIWLSTLHATTPVSVVVCGMCRGADMFGADWARSRGIPVDEHPADWSIGPEAGPIRNCEMALVADAVVLFAGGNGTADMARTARKHGLRIWDWRERDV